MKAKWLKTFFDPDQHWNLKIKEGNNIMPRQLTHQTQCSLPWLTITSLQKYLRNALEPWRSSAQHTVLSNQGSVILHLVPSDLHTGQQLLPSSPAWETEQLWQILAVMFLQSVMCTPCMKFISSALNINCIEMPSYAFFKTICLILEMILRNYTYLNMVVSLNPN